MIVQIALLAQLSLGQIPLATEAELPNGQKVSVAADQLLYEPSAERLVARGHTHLRAEGVSLRADEVIYDQKNQIAVARGNVMFVSGMLAAVADEVRVDIASLEATVKGGLFLRKRNVTEEQLLAARTPYELKKAGETVLTITGTHIKRVGENEFLVDDLSFTPCDCDPTEPSWRVEAASAEVELGERAILTWPVVYIRQVPVFALPWLYLPLAERRTGLLIPRPNYSSLNGLSLEQPFFLTLGESYDLTFTPGYYLGSTRPLVEAPYGISGGRMHTEFRYTPSVQTTGRATLGLLYDFRERRDPVVPFHGVGGNRGLRGEASLQHVQELGNGWFDRIDAGFVTDGYYFRDVTADVLARQAEYLRSTAVLYRRQTWNWYGVEAIVRQPLHTDTQPFGFDVFRRDVRQDGTVVEDPRTFARAPAFIWVTPERSLAGPLWGGLRAELSRTGPLTATFGDEGTDGTFELGTAPVTGLPREDPDGTQGNRAFDPGEREGRERLDLNPRLTLPIVGRFARFVPYLSFRETLWFGERTGQLTHRGYPVAGAVLGTTLVREFGTPDSAIRHAINPSVEMRYVPFVLGGVPGTPYDEIDAALPDADPRLGWPSNRPGVYEQTRLWQAVAEVSQELGVRKGAGYEEKLRLDLGQGVDLFDRSLADTYARLSFRHGPFSLSGIGRYDLPTGQVSQVSAGLNFDPGHGTAFYASYDNLIDVGSDPLRAGLDALVGDPLSVVPRTGAGDNFRRAQQVVGGFRTVLPFGLGLRYDAVVQPAAERPIAQQRVALSYGPGCGCWRLEVHAFLRPDFGRRPKGGVAGALGAPFVTPDFGASLTISQFGSFGTGG